MYRVQPCNNVDNSSASTMKIQDIREIPSPLFDPHRSSSKVETNQSTLPYVSIVKWYESKHQSKMAAHLWIFSFFLSTIHGVWSTLINIIYLRTWNIKFGLEWYRVCVTFRPSMRAGVVTEKKNAWFSSFSSCHVLWFQMLRESSPPSAKDNSLG